MKEYKNHYVYMIINSINNKKYIGKRSCDCPVEQDRYMGGGTRLKEDQEKLGLENFSKIILAHAFDEGMAFELENYYIKKADAVESDDFYNETYGGTGSSMFYHEDIERRKRVRKTLSEKNKGTNAGENSKVARKVICLTTGQIFVSGAEASRYANLNRGSVIKACRQRNHTRYAGFHPETGERLQWMYLDEYEAIQKGEKYIHKEAIRKRAETINMRKVICLNNNKIFKSLAEASKFYNIPYGSYLSQCCNGKKESAGIDPETGEKLKWMYYEDYLEKFEGKKAEELSRIIKNFDLNSILNK